MKNMENIYFRAVIFDLKSIFTNVILGSGKVFDVGLSLIRSKEMIQITSFDCQSQIGLYLHVKFFMFFFSWCTCEEEK